MRNVVYVVAVAFAVIFSGCSGQEESINVIPEPLSVSYGSGSFALNQGAVIAVTDSSLFPVAEYMARMTGRCAGLELEPLMADEAGSQSPAIVISSECSSRRQSPDDAPEGGYVLEVSEKGVKIRCDSYSGAVNAAATFCQLVFSEAAESGAAGRLPSVTVLPCCRIKDAPEYGWRGVMLDVARHFFTVDEVKELLDMMALYKLNRFHWHLTDDEGWRIEIKRYPLLAEKGGWRRFDRNDRTCMGLASSTATDSFRIPWDRMKVSGKDTLYGGCYTQEQIREVVAYASVLGIDVIPEIDMPGHAMGAIANYPWLACSDDISWGKLFSCPMCPGKDEVLEFCRNVFSEVFELFPYTYVHIGGDEVDMSGWEDCPDCRRRMEDNGIDSTAGLHFWFIHEMEKFFNENGRKLIAWDDVLAGGLPEQSSVMWWHGWDPQPSVAAAKAGTDIIACPNAVFYMSYTGDTGSIGNIYGYGAVADSLFGDGISCLEGFHAPLWSEKVPSRERMQYMFFPRLLAVSELCWSSPEVMDEARFMRKLGTHLCILDALDIQYRIPDIGGFHDINAFVDSTYLTVAFPMQNLSGPSPDMRVFYTVDGSVPDMDSEEYTAPVLVKDDTDFTLRVFGKGGRQGEIYRTSFVRQEYSSPAAGAEDFREAGGELADGLSALWYDYAGESCREIRTATFKGRYIVRSISIPEEVSGNIGLVISGYIDIPEDGIYTFRLLSDDGSLLYLDGDLAIDNDGGHAPVEITAQKAMRKGLHPICVKYFDHNGGLLGMDVTAPDGSTISPECYKMTEI